MTYAVPTMTVGEAARRLGVSVETVRRWADAGRIRVVVLPSGHRRFYASDIEALLDGTEAAS